MMDRGGKRWRPILGMLLAENLGKDMSHFDANPGLFFMLASCEIVHNATLICDDIEDDSKL